MSWALILCRSAMRRIAVISTSLLMLPACANQLVTNTGNTDAYCSANGFAFHTDFSGAALYACSTGESGPLLTIAPEFAPINPSPWYAYRITRIESGEHSEEEPVNVVITQSYLHGQHRYSPWIRRAGDGWQALPASAQSQSADRLQFEYTVQIPEQGLQIAAQPLLTVEDSQDWSDQLALEHDLHTHMLLETSLGLRLQLYDSGSAQADGLILLLGRQHPPELTGAFAYQDFVERLFENDGLARHFRAKFRLVLVPIVNPDGVTLGHWRMNRGGMDLNRDWGPFTQPETRAIANWLDQAFTETPFTLLLDFHSTWNDVLYGQHLSDSPSPAGFNKAWYAALKARLGDATPPWSGQHNPGLPTAKSWARRVYGVSAITYEVGDQTPRDAIRHKARVSAEEMMRALLPEGSSGNVKAQ